MYKVVIDKKAEKYIKKLDSSSRKRISNSLLELSENPFTNHNVKKLKGFEDIYRKRVGDFRIIFKVEDDNLAILILKIGSRGDVYK